MATYFHLMEGPPNHCRHPMTSKNDALLNYIAADPTNIYREPITFTDARTLFHTSKTALMTTTDRNHSWSNSVCKKLFLRLLEMVTHHYGLWVTWIVCTRASGAEKGLRLLEMVTPHYGLWVSSSTGGDEHQPGSSVLELQEQKRACDYWRWSPLIMDFGCRPPLEVMNTNLDRLYSSFRSRKGCPAAAVAAPGAALL